MKMRLLVLGLLVAISGVCEAHKPSDSYLRLSAESDSRVIEGRWDIALRDLQHAIGLDGNGNGEITWGELRSRHQAIARLALDRLSVSADERTCALEAGDQEVIRHSDGAYTVLHFRARCETEPSEVSVRYSLFADMDPSHRGLLRFQSGDTVETTVLGPDNPTFTMVAGEGSTWAGLGRFIWEGVWHIWIGFDHIAFLILLLLPSVLRRESGQWQAQSGLKDVMVDVAGVVTAFTVAHSVTLSLAALDVVALPTRWVELAIAASVALAAVYALRPLPISRGRWLIAFGFGLIHGFGFASVLGGLGLEGGHLALILAGFNVGVELGQLAIVLCVVPVLYALRHTRLYKQGLFPVASVLIGGAGVVWFVQRLVA